MAKMDILDDQKWRELAQKCGFKAQVLAEHFDVSQRQLQRYTHRLFGLSPQRWLAKQRLELAAGLIKQHRFIKFVAHYLNFKQASHFSREFKMHYGISPRTYLTLSDQQTRLQRGESGQMAAADI